MRDWLIALTPRQRAAYDVLWKLTNGGRHTWTGVLRIDRLNLEQVDADVKGLREMGVVRWGRVRGCRRFEVLVTPSRLAAKPPRRDFGSKLKDGPPVERALPTGRPRSFSPTDGAATGIRLDDGRFSRVFERAFPSRDYAGQRPISTYSQPVENNPVSRNAENVALVKYRHNFGDASAKEGSV